MRPPRQQSQHARGILRIARLAEKDVIDYDDRIRAQHPLPRIVLKNYQRLLPRQSLRAHSRSFPGERSFVDVGGLHPERNSGEAQKFLAARRGRGKDDRHENSFYRNTLKSIDFAPAC
jgi:hypothetical protein